MIKKYVWKYISIFIATDAVTVGKTYFTPCYWNVTACTLLALSASFPAGSEFGFCCLFFFNVCFLQENLLQICYLPGLYNVYAIVVDEV